MGAIGCDGGNAVPGSISVGLSLLDFVRPPEGSVKVDILPVPREDGSRSRSRFDVER